MDQSFLSEQVKSLLSKAVKAKGALQPPINPASLADLCGVLSIESRPMVPEGVLAPVEGGFRVFIQSNFADRPGANRRQRFTIAHELVHTFYYDLTEEIPRRSKGSPTGQKLERLCHIGASQILVPEILLRDEVKKNGEVESAQSVLDLARIFDVSPEVMIRRLHGLNGVLNDNFAAILVETANGGNQLIYAACYSPVLLCHATKPERDLNFDFWATPFRLLRLRHKVPSG